jgi:hypothetical protein
MKVNMIFADRALRMLVSVALLIMYFTNTINQTAGMWLMPVAVVFFITSYTGFCPIYGMLGITKKKHLA